MAKTKNVGRGRPKKDFNRKYTRKPKKWMDIEKTFKVKKISTEKSKRNWIKKKNTQITHKWLYILWIFVISIFIFSLILNKYKKEINNIWHQNIIISNLSDTIETTANYWEENQKVIQNKENLSSSKNSISTWNAIEVQEWENIENLERGNTKLQSWIIISKIEDNENNKTENPKQEKNILSKFYEHLSLWEIDNVDNIVDFYLKKTNTYKNYYGESWINKFFEMIDEDSFEIKNIEKIPDNPNKPNNEYYKYTLSYSISNEVFEENWEAIVINRDEDKKIWSLQCINKWCSTMPFFNPEKYK